ncbi:hypothetical protein X737_31915 [Mesorhizobium sp. L48C026A00]|nr:hypothetical protein X737_31915 [Mesorhizobium sp. L48C026A00]
MFIPAKYEIHEPTAKALIAVRPIAKPAQISFNEFLDGGVTIWSSNPIDTTRF